MDPATQQYLNDKTCPCPECGISCVHIGGCKSVQCCLCGRYFSWDGPSEAAMIEIDQDWIKIYALIFFLLCLFFVMRDFFVK